VPFALAPEDEQHSFVYLFQTKPNATRDTHKSTHRFGWVILGQVNVLIHLSETLTTSHLGGILASTTKDTSATCHAMHSERPYTALTSDAGSTAGFTVKTRLLSLLTGGVSSALWPFGAIIPLLCAARLLRCSVLSHRVLCEQLINRQHSISLCPASLPRDLHVTAMRVVT
jgi:hypothetical protein